MTQYIDKSTIVLEIEKLKGLLLKGACASQISMQANCKEEAYNEILSFISTLEVKEVDLNFEKELYKAFGQVKDFTLGMHIAKHFYELGLKAR